MSGIFSSMQAEQSVIGSLMIDNSTWEYVADKLTGDDFFYANNRSIFSVIAKLSEDSKPFDLVTMVDELKALRILDDIGGTAYLINITEDTPTAKNIGAYAEMLVEKSLRRRIAKANDEINVLTHDSSFSNDEILEKFEQTTSSITTGSADKISIVGIKKSLVDMVERIENRYQNGCGMTGVSTGLIDLDAITHGLQKKDLIILAARPSVGKTACMMRIVEAVGLQENSQPILVFSIEMPESALTERMTSSVGRIDLDKMRTGAFDDPDWPRLTSAISLLSGTKIFYCDTSSITLAGMRTVIKKVEREHGKLGLIAIDYLQLIDGQGGENETLKIGRIAEGLKAIARDHDVPMLALSQLNRSLESRADKRPMASDLRQSGAIEQAADLILMLYRDAVYNPDSADKNIMEINIVKHRNGELGSIKAFYEGKYTRVENLKMQQDY